MTIDSVAALTEVLGRHRLLTPGHLDEVKSQLQARFPDPRALAKELMNRNWLTPYQVNQIFQGRAANLQVGAYVIVERLGEGGMAQVFKARQINLERIVALKVIRKDRVANNEAVRRFQREVQVLAQLAHPNVVRAYDADMVGDTNFIAMEYVQGTDLGRRVKEKGPVAVADAVDYIRQAAIGLQHAHEKGLVHRDLKPSNLFLAQEHQAGSSTPKAVVKILDLGLARLGDIGEEDAASSLTRPGFIVGSPDFIAPEQARNAHKADVRSDIYSLGCTFYFLLAGQVPFPGGTMTEKLLWHYTTEPRPIEQLRPDVPPGVVAVLRKMMAKQPDARYQTPADLAQALSTVLTTGAPVTMPMGVPTPATPVPEWEWSTLEGSAAIPLAMPVHSTHTAAQMLVATPVPTNTVEAPFAQPVPVSTVPQHWIIAGAVGGGVLLLALIVLIVVLLVGGSSSAPTKRPASRRAAAVLPVVAPIIASRSAHG